MCRSPNRFKTATLEFVLLELHAVRSGQVANAWRKLVCTQRSSLKLWSTFTSATRWVSKFIQYSYLNCEDFLLYPIAILVEDYSTGSLKATLKSHSQIAWHWDFQCVVDIFVDIVDRNYKETPQAPLNWCHAELQEIRQFLIERVKDGSYKPVLFGLMED